MGFNRGKLFWRKVFPGPLSKDFGTRGRGYADPEFYRYGSIVPGFVRSAFGDPDLRSPSGFDSGLRPPLRMTRRGGFCRSNAEATIIAMVAPALFIDIQRRNKRKPSPVGEGGSRRLTDEVSGISKFFPRTPHPPLPWSPFSHRRRLFY